MQQKQKADIFIGKTIEFSPRFMELLLNLLWLMLVVPGFLVWRRKQRSVGDRGPHCILVLGCVLALLFPVVSATDDLHPICGEMEESSPSKRTVKLSPGAAVAWDTAGGITPLVVPTSCFTCANDDSEPVSELLPTVFESLTADTMGCRPPPTLI